MYTRLNINYREVEPEECCITCHNAEHNNIHACPAPDYIRCDKVDDDCIIQPKGCAKNYVCDLWELKRGPNKREKALAKLTKEDKEILGLE